MQLNTYLDLKRAQILIYFSKSKTVDLKWTIIFVPLKKKLLPIVKYTPISEMLKCGESV